MGQVISFGYTIPQTSTVKLKLLDLTGRQRLPVSGTQRKTKQEPNIKYKIKELWKTERGKQKKKEEEEQ